jgi:tripartite-type tricarboxylate transporter receptor subunit TctC
MLAAVASPEVQARFKAFNFETVAWSPAETRRAIETRTATYEQVITRNNIKLD